MYLTRNGSKLARRRAERAIPTLAAASALLLAAAALLSPRAALAKDAETSWGKNYFPNVVLTTQDGKKVRLWDDLLKDRKVVINFIYTSCGASCPLETAKLREVQQILGDRMGKDIFFYSFTLDPKHDTPEVLKAYAERYKVGPGWTFLTGKQADIEVVRKKLGQAAAPDQDRLTDHTTTLMLGNTATGQWVRDGAMDDPRYIAVMVGDWLSSWQRHIKGESYTMAPAADESTTDRGAYLFKTRCSACHTVGSGDKIGPDLLGVAEARSHEWLTRYVSTPDEVLASGDPIATALFEKYRKVRMPNLRLGQEDVTALIRFLRGKGAAGQVPVKTSELRMRTGAGALRAPVEQAESLSFRSNDRNLASGFELPRKGEAP